MVCSIWRPIPFSQEKSFQTGILPASWISSGARPNRTRPTSACFGSTIATLAIQQLGTVYEGLLELHPRYAKCDMRVVRARRAASKLELIQPAANQVSKGYESTSLIYKAGTIYLATDKGERRRTGSYYTPDHIVDHIVQKTLGAQCNAIFEQLQCEITFREGDLRKQRRLRSVPRLERELRGTDAAPSTTAFWHLEFSTRPWAPATS